MTYRRQELININDVNKEIENKRVLGLIHDITSIEVQNGFAK